MDGGRTAKGATTSRISRLVGNPRSDFGLAIQKLLRAPHVRGHPEGQVPADFESSHDHVPPWETKAYGLGRPRLKLQCRKRRFPTRLTRR